MSAMVRDRLWESCFRVRRRRRGNVNTRVQYRITRVQYPQHSVTGRAILLMEDCAGKDTQRLFKLVLSPRTWGELSAWGLRQGRALSPRTWVNRVLMLGRHPR